MILEQRRDGVFIKDIAEHLGVHPKTVSRALARGGEPGPAPKASRPTKLDPFKSLIDRCLADGIWNGAVILRKLKAVGYIGGYTQLLEYIKPKRALRPKGVVRFETPPGEQLQHDWCEVTLEIGGEAQKVYLAVNTLGYARAVHVVAMPSCDAEHTYEALIQGFEYFGGSCRAVLVDNQKSAVLNWREGHPCFNPRFRELGRHYGFTPRACRPRRAQTKGKVERMVGYVKGNALAGRPAFDSLAELNTHLVHWCDTVANTPRHAGLKAWVGPRWEHEREHLQALPAARFDTAYRAVRQASLDAYVSWDGARYSVPGHLAGEAVELVISLAGVLTARHDGAVVAEHRLAERHSTVTIAQHHAALWAAVRVAERGLDDYAALEEAV